jgi:hypothetical protein
MDRTAIGYKHSMASIDPLTLSVKAAQVNQLTIWEFILFFFTFLISL